MNNKMKKTKMKQLSRLIAIMTALVLASSQAVSADGWGSFKGKFVYDGKASKPAAIKVTADPQFCGKFDLVDELVVVNPKNGGVKNVIVYLYLTSTEKPPAVHPSYAKAAKVVRIDNKDCRFEPHIVTMTLDQTLEIGNVDKVSHNSKLDVIDMNNISINPIIPAGKSYLHKYNVEERLPNPLSCSIHGWMKGYILVRKSPYFAVSDEDGNFEIKDLPEGEWTFRLWQENVGYVQKVKLNGKSTTWRGGRVKAKISAGKTFDLGEVKSDFVPIKR
ncbi:MAG: hypothetical protein VB878_12650 [Pirellulaceae bacterium]